MDDVLSACSDFELKLCAVGVYVCINNFHVWFVQSGDYNYFLCHIILLWGVRTYYLLWLTDCVTTPPKVSRNNVDLLVVR